MNLDNEHWNPQSTPASRRLAEADARLRKLSPLFIICSKCKREVLNAGDGLCVTCGFNAALRGMVGLR